MKIVPWVTAADSTQIDHKSPGSPFTDRQFGYNHPVR